MAPRSIATGRITFGLVSIPVQIYPAIAGSAGLSFHLLHKKDNARLKQQYICSEDGEIVPRSEMVKGYEIEKGQYVVFTPGELKALDERSTQGIEIAEFVPSTSVDPVYFEKSYYLGPDKGAEKPFALLASAMEKSGRLAVAKYAARGKDYLVLLRAADGRFVMQQLHHTDEVRPADDIPSPDRRTSEAEMELALQLIDRISSPRFEPHKYEDEVRKRVEAAIREKAEGEAIAPPAHGKERGQVIDLVEALKASLSGGAGEGRKPPRRATARRPASAATTRSTKRKKSAGRTSATRTRRAS